MNIPMLGKVIGAAAASALLLVSTPASVNFSNPDIGLQLSYPSDWTPLQAAERQRAIDAAEKAPGSPSGEQTKEVLGKLALGIHKRHRVPKGMADANLMVMAQPVSEDTCRQMNDGSLESTEAAAYSEVMPGGQLAGDRHVRVRGLRGYTGEYASKDQRKIVQHVYWYCFGHQGVVVQSTSGSPETEAELAGILASIRVSGR